MHKLPGYKQVNSRTGITADGKNGPGNPGTLSSRHGPEKFLRWQQTGGIIRYAQAEPLGMTIESSITDPASLTIRFFDHSESNPLLPLDGGSIGKLSETIFGNLSLLLTSERHFRGSPLPLTIQGLYGYDTNIKDDPYLRIQQLRTIHGGDETNHDFDSRGNLHSSYFTAAYSPEQETTNTPKEDYYSPRKRELAALISALGLQLNSYPAFFRSDDSDIRKGIQSFKHLPVHIRTALPIPPLDVLAEFGTELDYQRDTVTAEMLESFYRWTGKILHIRTIPAKKPVS